MSEKCIAAGSLYVVATPIGCLDDISLRAISTLRDVDCILAEDTRHTRILCKHHDIDTRLESFHEHSSAKKTDALIKRMLAGTSFALVSDAGHPLVSDPGSALIRRAAEEQIVVVTVPGPSAVLAALSVAGFDFYGFTFDGFFPRSGKKRREALEQIANRSTVSIVFESPRRVKDSLRDLQKHLEPTRRIALCRELTKVHEEVLRGPIDEVLKNLPDPLKGEITIVIEGALQNPQKLDVDEEALVEMLDSWITRGLRHKEIAEELHQATGWSKKKAYNAITEYMQTRVRTEPKKSGST